MSLIRFILSFIACLVGIILIIPAVIIVLPILLIAQVKKLWTSFKPKISEWEDIIQFDRQFGWQPKPNVQTQMNTDGAYRVTVGADGWRGNYSLKECQTIIIGDSFVFGNGTDDKNHFAELTKKTKVKPIGAPGYGTAHYLLILKTLTAELHGKLVIWFVFTGNDYREAIRPTSYGYHFPFVYYDEKTQSYKMRTDNIHPKKLPFNFERGYKTSVPELADLYYKNYLSDYAFGAFDYLTAEAKKHCESYGAKFAIITIPLWWLFDEQSAGKIKRYCSNIEKFSAHYPDERAAEICKRHHIPFRPGNSHFNRKDFLPNDFHFSRLGNQKAAHIIDDLYISFLKTKPIQ